MLDDVNFFLCYFVVGGWQIFSVLVHLVTEGLKLSKMRKIYLISLVIVIGILVISLPGEVIIFSLMGLLFVAPVMAVFYLVTCYRELQTYRQAGTMHMEAQDLQIAPADPGSHSPE